MLPPRGYLPLREAVIRLAEARHPHARVQAYLNPPPKPVGTILGDARQFADKWYQAFRRDPFEQLQGDDLKHPAWAALEAACAELLEALGNGDLTATEQIPDGEEEAGDVRSIPARRWLTDAGYSILRFGYTTDQHGKEQRFVALVGRGEFERWLAGESATQRPVVSDAQLRKWYSDYVAAHIAAGTAPSRDQAWKDAADAFPSHIPPVQRRMRELRAMPPTPDAWRSLGRRPTRK